MVVDHNTVFATLIMQAEAVPGVECYPRPVMKWSEGLYKPVFSPHGPFRLQEHGKAAITDYGAYGMLAVAVMADRNAAVMQRSEGFAERAVCQTDESYRTSAVHADYTFGEQKFGGNAQAITKQRWLHHTSFLWDFDDSNMALLKHPSRVPKYRLVIPCPAAKDVNF